MYNMNEEFEKHYDAYLELFQHSSTEELEILPPQLFTQLYC